MNLVTCHIVEACLYTFVENFDTNSFSQSCTTSVFLGHSSDSGRPKNSWGGEASGKHWVHFRGSMEGAQFLSRHAYYSCLLWTIDTISSNFLRSLFLQHILHQSACEFPSEINFNCENLITLPTLQVTQISIFLFNFKFYNEWVKEL